MTTISISDAVLLAHAGSGVIGCLAAAWVMAEALNARAENARRIRAVALVVAVAMAAAWVCGGYWYVHFYPAEKALILAGPWPFAHNVFMEVKEHLFFITGILALLLPIAAWENLHANSAARRMVICVAGMILVTGLTIEGAGAVIDHGVKIALLRGNANGAQ
jgi:hypothetical protein